MSRDEETKRDKADGGVGWEQRRRRRDTKGRKGEGG